jgi:hypothetical protein
VTATKTFDVVFLVLIGLGVLSTGALFGLMISSVAAHH